MNPHRYNVHRHIMEVHFKNGKNGRDPDDHIEVDQEALKELYKNSVAATSEMAGGGGC